MNVSYSAKLVAGISLNEFFEDIWQIKSSYDEHDAKGEKTGKKIIEIKINATLPKGEEIIIGEIDMSSSRREINYNFSTFGFEDNTSDKTFLELHYHNYENYDLSKIIMGKEIKTSHSVEEINQQNIVSVIEEVKREFEQHFSYVREVKLYLIRTTG